jgi:hypothetical protein
VGVSLAAILCIVSGFMGYARGQDAGYQIGVLAGVGTGYDLRDPTYSEMREFLKQDLTDHNTYIEEEYTCSDFAADVDNDAEQQGFRCALVQIKYPDEKGHAIVAFNTVDRGLIFIEPQYDKEVIVEVGQSYSKLNKFKSQGFDDIIVRYLIIW